MFKIETRRNYESSIWLRVFKYFFLFLTPFFQDIFTTLVDAQWRWTLLVFSMNFLLSWLGFALIWWLIAYSHGDLDPNNYTNPNLTFTPCIVDIQGFTSSFLFSIETQHTIGWLVTFTFQPNFMSDQWFERISDAIKSLPLSGEVSPMIKLVHLRTRCDCR